MITNETKKQRQRQMQNKTDGAEKAGNNVECVFPIFPPPPPHTLIHHASKARGTVVGRFRLTGRNAKSDRGQFGALV